MAEVGRMFSDSDVSNMAPMEKIGLVATVSPDGLPHITNLTSMRPKTANELIIGEFSVGFSKQYMQQNSKVGFLVLLADRRFWRGKANWKRLSKEGDDYAAYNMEPMFRYNAYFGINTVHYLDLVHCDPFQKLPLGTIIPATLITKLTGRLAGKKGEPVLNAFSKTLFNGFGNLAFVSWVGDDGYPVLIPALQANVVDGSRVVFSRLGTGELANVPNGTQVAVYAMTFEMESVLVRGSLGREKGLATVDIDWVYNSMPPNHGQIYPMPELKEVVDF